MAIELVNEDVIKQAQLGDQESINIILREYRNLIYLNVRNYFIIGAEQDDLLQEGTIGLLKALKAYQKGKSSFKTFAMICIRRQILTAVKASNTQKNTALNLASGNYIECDGGKEIEYSKGLQSYVNYDPEEIFLTKEKLNNFRSFVNENFSSFEKEVFDYMIKGYSYREIANEMDKSLKTIDNSLQRIKRKSELWISSYQEKHG